MKKMPFLYLFILSGIIFSCTSNQRFVPDENFNANWKFYKGVAEGAENPAFDDSGWRSLELPHDWAIEGPFDIQYNARTGGLPVHGTGWYRKTFKAPKSHEGKKVSLLFDGAMNNAHVWVNGQLAGNRPFGYIGFEVDMTPYLNIGEDNVVAVRLAPEDLSSRWYSGAGIYRNVHLKVDDPIHIPVWGTYITTEVKGNKADVQIQTTLKSEVAHEKEVVLETIIKDEHGTEISAAKEKVLISHDKENIVEQHFEIEHPKLWHIGAPNLYKAISVVMVDGVISDQYETEFGIRTIEFTSEEGFKLNGEHVKFQGVCLHHDHGPLGTAVNYRALERQMQIMQSMGVNAIRTSHNPPAPELLQVCDRLGLVVQVEAFDEWKIGKVANGYNKYFDEWHERDLRDMIRRDHNHPSVIMWSIGNEILEQGRKDGWKLAKHLSDICHDEDNTRPTTAGFNFYPAPFDNQLAMQIDVVGMNYWPLNYQDVLDKYPEMIVYGSETASLTSSRGVYHLPIDAMPQKETNHVSSYDVIVGPPWAYAPDIEFEQQEKVSKSLGEFMWTGMDYLGEPTPYGGRDNSTNGYWNDDWPSKSSYFAPVDLCGFPKDRYYLYQSQWTEKPMVHVLPHWNWEGVEGKEIPVFAYTNAEEVELFVNGKSYGRKVKGIDLTPIPSEFHFFEKGTYQSKYRLSWSVPYEKGSLKVVAYKDGKEVAVDERQTAGAPAKVILEADRTEIDADGKDLSYITVKIVDEHGNICPNADNLVNFEISGAGKLKAVGNGDQTSLQPFQEPRQKAFHGLCLLVVGSEEESGSIEVKGTSEGLSSDTIFINAK